jgi:hypothetical protein
MTACSGILFTRLRLSLEGFGKLGSKVLSSICGELSYLARTEMAEFTMLLCYIEACLNSRPIAELNDDPSDLSALTTGHFLIRWSLVAVPEISILEINAMAARASHTGANLAL